MVPCPPSGPPHHFHPPDGQPLGAEEEALARAPWLDRFRPRSVLDRLLPATGLSVRSSLPLPRLGGGERVRLRRDEQADLLWASRSSASGLAGSHSGRGPRPGRRPRPAPGPGDAPRRGPEKGLGFGRQELLEPPGSPSTLRNGGCACLRLTSPRRA